MIGGKVLEDERVADRVYEVEEQFYQQFAEENDLEDGLIVPYMINHESGAIPLPKAVALAKVSAITSFLEEHPEFRRLGRIVVNDSIWAVGPKDGQIAMAINKTDPNKNSGDVERLTEFFHDQGRQRAELYSVGCNAVIDAKSGKYRLSDGELRIGQLAYRQKDELSDIFSTHLKIHKAFDLQFILEEGLVIPETAVEISNGYDEVRIRAHAMDQLNP